jgi:hypothetical protein
MQDAGGFESALDGVELRPTMYDYTAGKRGKNRKRTAAEIDYQSRVAELGCICCRLLGVMQEGSTMIHHVRKGRLRSDCHYDVLPLCHSCHQGKQGVHGDKSILKAVGLSEDQLLGIVRDLMDI